MDLIFLHLFVVSNIILYDFLQVVLDSIGVSIWQMASQPCTSQQDKPDSILYENGNASESEDSEDDDNSVELYEEEDRVNEESQIAFACDDGCVRIYSASSLEELTHKKSLPRISGETATCIDC